MRCLRGDEAVDDESALLCKAVPVGEFRALAALAARTFPQVPDRSYGEAIHRSFSVAPIMSIAAVKAMRRPAFKAMEALFDRLVGWKGKQFPDTRKQFVRAAVTDHPDFS